MTEEQRKTLRATGITIAISVAALAMAVILIFLNARQGKVSWVGIIIAVAMIINIIPAEKSRSAIKKEIKAKPRL